MISIDEDEIRRRFEAYQRAFKGARDAERAARHREQMERHMRKHTEFLKLWRKK